jgi:ABC-2 type transport system ATP-binding protein
VTTDRVPGTDGAVDAADVPAAITTRALEKRYFDQPALAPVDLVVPVGQRITLIGHNGSGKTTLLRMLGGTLEPTAGDATIAGAPVGSLAARADVSFLTDRPVFYDDLTVWEHLEFVARLHGTSDWEQHAVDLLDAVGLTARADDLPSTFSRGLEQKAAIAIAFVRPFEVLLVDEPFVGLDRTGREALLELFADVHAAGATVVVATHELASAARSDRVLALRDGSLIFDGPPGEADVAALTAGDADGRHDDDAEHVEPADDDSAGDV